MKTTFLHVMVDMEEQRYFIERPDDPANPLREISLGAAVQIGKDAAKYEHDFYKETHRI